MPQCKQKYIHKFKPGDFDGLQPSRPQRRVCQGRGVAEAGIIILGYLAQDTAHDFPRTGFRQAGSKLKLVGRGDGADLLADPAGQLLAQFLIAGSPAMRVT